jgi:F-type H+-transporting ATPase subunit b
LRLGRVAEVDDVELSLSTFVLEMINFLVLVWILKRFLYRPVLDVVARRREKIDATMAEAKRIDDEAQELKERYEKRLDEWELEQTNKRAALAHELAEERARQLAELRKSLDEEVEKSRAAEARRVADLEDKLEREGLALGARFASRLLGISATPELQTRLLDLFAQDFDATPPERFANLLGNPELGPDSVDVSSAFQLTEAQRTAVDERAKKLCGSDVPVRFAEDPDLLAGIRLSIGGCVLGLNLKDELEGFARLRNVGP